MRVSSDPRSPFHWRKFSETPPTILLDGKEIEEVAEADDEIGYVETVRMNGAYPVHMAGKWITDRHEGKVEIKF